MYTLTTFIIEPLKALGEGIGGFFRALLKDLPLLTWTLVLIIITIFILVVLMGGLLVVFHQQPRRFLPWLYRNQGRNVNTQAPNQLQNDNVRLEQIVIHQSQPNGTKGEINIQFLRSAGRPHIEEVPDVEGRQGSTDERNNISVKYSFEDQQKIQEEVRFSSVTPTDQAKGNQPKLDYSQAKNKKVKAEKEGSHDEPCGDATAPAPRAYRRKGFSIPKIHTENVSAQKI
ncbi:chloride channel CLIC-like protein 1 [Poecilia latipinna]|uniref:chloride channel CLIC-like protein 1 n=1 Tax=Poecilia latipinna TaxID=48699 RepID=UPI00072ED8A4|nr:PREDICTED: chloride channel CLIC-like protein 1 [Poecilia latipinna]